MTEVRLREILDQFPGIRLAVIGDYFLDKYLVIDSSLSEVSLETGKEVYQVVEIRHSPGAAGNVCNNLVALEVGTIYAVGLVGDDGQGYELGQDLEKQGVRLDHLVECSDVFTPTYTKPMERAADGTEEEMNRIDIKNRHQLSSQVHQQLIDQVTAVVSKVDGVIIADQDQEPNCGVVSDQMRPVLAKLAAANPDKVFLVDSRTRIGQFDKVMTKPNRHEVAAAVQTDAPETVSRPLAEQCGQQLAASTGQPVFVTLDAEGISVCSADSCTHVPTIAPPGEIDITGAGDSTAAGITCSLCAGATLAEAALVGNLTASITIQQISTTGTATPQQMIEQFGRYQWE